MVFVPFIDGVMASYYKMYRYVRSFSYEFKFYYINEYIRCIIWVVTFGKERNDVRYIHPKFSRHTTIFSVRFHITNKLIFIPSIISTCRS